MTSRIIDNADGHCCPICGADKTAIIVPDSSKPDYYICSACGYDESQSAKFPSHNE